VLFVASVSVLEPFLTSGVVNPPMLPPPLMLKLLLLDVTVTEPGLTVVLSEILVGTPGVSSNVTRFGSA
jgi:hypothetical protein